MLLDDGVVLTGSSPDFVNVSASLCHEVEPYCAAFRLDRKIVASVCLTGLRTGAISSSARAGSAASGSPTTALTFSWPYPGLLTRPRSCG